MKPFPFFIFLTPVIVFSATSNLSNSMKIMASDCERIDDKKGNNVQKGTLMSSLFGVNNIRDS